VTEASFFHDATPSMLFLAVCFVRAIVFQKLVNADTGIHQNNKLTTFENLSKERLKK
jgi:hypothetical protein